MFMKFSWTTKNPLSKKFVQQKLTLEVNLRWRRPPSWKHINNHNSAALWDIFTKLGMAVHTFWRRDVTALEVNTDSQWPRPSPLFHTVIWHNSMIHFFQNKKCDFLRLLLCLMYVFLIIASWVTRWSLLSPCCSRDSEQGLKDNGSIGSQCYYIC